MGYGLGAKNAMTVLVEGIIAGEAEMSLAAIVARWQRRFPVDGSYPPADMVMPGLPTGYLTALYPLTVEMVTRRLVTALTNPAVPVAPKLRLIKKLSQASGWLRAVVVLMPDWESAAGYVSYAAIETALDFETNAVRREGAAIALHAFGLLLATDKPLPDLDAQRQQNFNGARDALCAVVLEVARFVETAEAAGLR